MPFVIRMECEEEILYWSGADGWVDRPSATVFTYSEWAIKNPMGATGREPA